MPDAVPSSSTFTPFHPFPRGSPPLVSPVNDMVRVELPLLLGSAVSAVSATSIQYSTVTGYFLQDVNATNATTFDYVSGRLGGTRRYSH